MISSVMTSLYSADVPAAVRFYRDYLGGEETFVFPSQGQPRHVELRIGDSVLAITDWNEVPLQGLPEPCAGHPMELVVWCESVDDQFIRLEDSGAEMVIAPYDHLAGMRRAYVADPDGNWVALVSALPATDTN